MHNLIPHFIYEQHQQGHTHGRFPATTLFLDISGFTAMTQALMQHGKEGAEVLADIINRVFDPIIHAVYERGGFITGFAGDAFTAVFPTDDEAAALNACATALKIRQTFVEIGHQQTKLGHFTLEMKQGLSAGKVEWGIVGPDQHQTYFFRGPAIDSCAQAEHQAKGGDIVVDAHIQTLLSPDSVSLQTLDTHYAQLIGFSPETKLPQPQTASLPDIPQAVANQFFPQSLWQATQQGEFRDVATLFVSFRGASDLDRMNDFIRPVMTLVNQFDGFFVEIDYGDKGGMFLVYFGAPTTHENDVERALSFILAMQSELRQVDLEWRAGITFGTVYAGFVGIPLRDKYTCMGSIVNLAARLMMQAEWGQLLVSKPIALHPSFNFVALGQLSYKGFSELVPTYLLEGKTIAQKIFQQKMVGRENELQQLVKFAQPLFSDQNAGVVMVYGQAGMGKSHLIYSLEQTLGAKVRWLTGQCDPMLREAFNPFVYFLKGYFGQVATANETENKAHFENRLQDLWAALRNRTDSRRQHDELVRTQSFLGAMLNLHWPNSLYEQLDAKGRYENTIIAVSMLLQAECKRQPVVLELEDGHWLDEVSQELLTTLTRQIKDVPLLIIITSRYADDGSRPTYTLDRDTPTLTLDLETLTAVAIQELAQEIVGTPISVALQTLLMEKTAANPFFSQQILYYLQENQLLQLAEVAGETITTVVDTNFELPTTINALLIARLDRLTQAVKEVVQTAAVLGREFELPLLTQMLKRDIMGEVTTAEQGQVWSLLDKLQYIFKHVLLRDASYQMQLRVRLRELHHLAAVTGEQLYASQLPAYYGTLAYHYEVAYLLGQKEAQERAIHYLQQAGQQAWGNFENVTATNYFSRALAITPLEATKTRYELLLAREKTYHIQGDREGQRADLESMMTIAPQLGHHAQAQVALRQATYAHVISAYEQAIQYIQNSIQWAQQANDQSLVAEGYGRWGSALAPQGKNLLVREKYQMGLQQAQAVGDRKQETSALIGLGFVASQLGEYATAQEYYEQALAISQQIGDRYEEGRSFEHLSSIAMYLEDYASAQRYSEQALAISQQIGDRLREGWSLSNLGIYADGLGDYATARGYYEQALAISQQIGDQQGVGASLGNLGFVTYILGDYASAKGYHEQSLAIKQEIGNRNGEGLAFSNLSLVCHQQGEQMLAQQHGLQAIEIAREVGSPFLLGYALTHLGHALVALGQLDEAMVAYQEAYTLRHEAGQRDMSMEPLAGLARVAVGQGDEAQAFAYAERIYAYLAEHELTGAALDPMRVYLTCYQILAAAGDVRAEALLATAYNMIQTIAAKLPEGMRATYLAVPSHAGIVAAWGENQADHQ